MEGHLDESIKKARAHILLELSDTMHRQWLAQFIGQTVDVVIESYGLSHSHGYTSEYAYVTINGSAPIGSLVKAKVSAVKDDQLMAELLQPSTDR